MNINKIDSYQYLNKSQYAKGLDFLSSPLRCALGRRAVDLTKTPPTQGNKAHMITRIFLGIIAALFCIVTVPAYFLRKGLITKGSEAAKIQGQIGNLGKAAPSPSLTAHSRPLDLRRTDLITAKYHHKFPDVSMDEKYRIRDLTKKEVFHNSNLYELEQLQKQVRLYQGDYSAKPDNLLNRFDVVQVPCQMQYGYDWKPLNGNQNPFFLHHAAAINIGESARSQDFADYSRNGRLNEALYVQDMGKIFHNVLSAQTKSGVKDAVWFPFGMGAFLRHLGKMDASYNEEKIFQLRQKITAEFIRQAEQFPVLTLHMCLPNTEGEGTQNYNAFISAFQSGSKGLKKRTRFYINCDASQVAQQLANTNGANSVSLVNGANRKLLGNHWFGNHAMKAIDENLHRRSPMLAKVSYWLNDGKEVKVRRSNELANRIASVHRGEE